MPSDIIKRPYVTGFCSTEHDHSVENSRCPYLITHRDKKWQCHCSCHDGQDKQAFLDETQSPVSNGGPTTTTGNGMVVSVDTWEKIWHPNGLLNQLRESLSRVL